jgi:hypothetical protein
LVGPIFRSPDLLRFYQLSPVIFIHKLKIDFRHKKSTLKRSCLADHLPRSNAQFSLPSGVLNSAIIFLFFIHGRARHVRKVSFGIGSDYYVKVGSYYANWWQVFHKVNG